MDLSPATPSGILRLLGLGLRRLEGSRSALLLTLDAGDAALLDEEAQRSAHLLSRDTELRGHLLVGDGSVLLPQSVEDALAEVDNLLVHLGLTGTSGVLLDLGDLLLAELDDLGVVSHGDDDAGVEVLLGGLGLGHDSLFFLGLASRSLLRVPLTRSFLRRSSSFFLFFIYIIS